MMPLHKNFIFKDQLCQAMWGKTSVTCQQGELKFTGNVKLDFQLYYTWCKKCDKIKVIDRNELQKQFKDFAEAVVEELEKT